MGLTSIWHWIILLVVVVAVFGTSKLKNAGKDLGQAVKGFKDAVKDENQAAVQQAQLESSKPQSTTANDIRIVKSDEIIITDHRSPSQNNPNS